MDSYLETGRDGEDEQEDTPTPTPPDPPPMEGTIIEKSQDPEDVEKR